MQAVGGGAAGLSPLQDLLLRSVTVALTGARTSRSPCPSPPAVYLMLATDHPQRTQ